MNISKPISTASRLRATFTSSAAPERAGKPIHATLSLDPGLHRRLKLAAATRGVTMSELVSSWIESNCPALDGRQANNQIIMRLYKERARDKSMIPRFGRPQAARSVSP